MKKHHLFLFLLLVSSISIKAQIITKNLTGILKDTTGYTVIGAAVKLTSVADTFSTVTDVNGAYNFKGLKASVGNLQITALGYKAQSQKYAFAENQYSLNIPIITLTNDSRQLNEVVVDGTPEVLVKEDTLQFRADAYKLKDNALAEDLLKKLPGVEVDRDGNVTAQGKQITKIRINGKDFFGGDVKTATQQLPADLLENVQIVDDYGDQANLTGIKDGDPDKILNFTIKPEKNQGFLTRGTVGAGNEGRYQASVFSAKFNNDQQISLLANLNNTNANIFNLTSSGGGRSGRGSRGSGFGSGDSDGLTDVKSLGLNYRDQWSKKLTVYGSYSIAGKDNEVSNDVFQQNLSNNQSTDNREISKADNNSTNHRFDFNLEYKIDSLNYLKVSPRFSYGISDDIENSNFSIDTNSVNLSNGNYVDKNKSKNPSFSTSVLYNHKFGRTQRNLSLSADVSTSSSTNNQDYVNINTLAADPNNPQYQRQLIENDNNNDNLRLRLSYNEPLSATTGLEFNYDYGYSNIKNKREVLSTEDESVDPATDFGKSNEYDFKFITNKFGLNYRVRQTKYNYTLGFAAQPSVLTGNSNSLGVSTKKEAVNFFPTGRFEYKFSKTKGLNIYYNGSSNQPSYSQLQPITDNSNPQFPVTGNPKLDAEFNSNFNIRYNNFDIEKGNVIFTNLSYSFSKDKIVTNTINIDRAANPNTTAIQETEYLNADGYYAVNGFYAFSKSFSDKKYVLGLRGSANYNNLISYVDSVKNTGKNLILSQRLQFQVQPNDWLELTPAVSYTYNRNNNSIDQRSNSEVNTWSLRFDSKVYFTKSFLFGTQADKSFNSGYNNSGTNPFVINAYLEKQFFKGNAGALRLSAFDILDENTSISRTVNAGTTVDRVSNRLSRYFMLTFTMKINKFAGKNTQEPDMGGERHHYGPR